MRIGLVHLFPSQVNNETNVDRTNELDDLTQSLSLRFPTVTIMCSLVASVSVWFRSKERPRKGTFGFDRARNETRVKKKKKP